MIKPFDQDELRARVQVGRLVTELQAGLAARVRELEAALAQVKQLQACCPSVLIAKKFGTIITTGSRSTLTSAIIRRSVSVTAFAPIAGVTRLNRSCVRSGSAQRTGSNEAWVRGACMHCC